jgi:hypothetical protein
MLMRGFILNIPGRKKNEKWRMNRGQASILDRDTRSSPPASRLATIIASRLITINNANASISRTYFNDNLLSSETETITGGVARTVSYIYDEDGDRDSLQFPRLFVHLRLYGAQPIEEDRERCDHFGHVRIRSERQPKLSRPR